MQRHTSPHDSRSGRRSASRTTGEPERRHKRSQLGACRTDWHTAFQKREECTSWRRTSTSTDADPAQKKATRAATTSQRRESKRQTMTRNTGEAPDAETNSLRAKHTGTDSHSTGTKRKKHTSRTRHGTNQGEAEKGTPPVAGTQEIHGRRTDRSTHASQDSARVPQKQVCGNRRRPLKPAFCRPQLLSSARRWRVQRRRCILWRIWL